MANGDAIAGGPKKESTIVCNSDRLVTLMDVAGHEKNLKATNAGVSCGMADHVLVLLVNAMQPPTHMAMHHLTLCVASGTPVVVVMTKAGMSSSVFVCSFVWSMNH
jgi:GTPase